MAVISMPAAGIRSVAWTFDNPAQVNRSGWTGRRKAAILIAAPMWRAQVALTTKQSDIDVFAWRAFLMKLRGVQNSFRLKAVEKSQIAGVTVLVKGAGQTGFSLVTDGWGAAGLKLKAGQMITVGDQLIMLGADVIADGTGTATLTLESYMRASPADNAPVEVANPTAIMALGETVQGWNVDPGRLYGFSFACEEVW